MSVGYISQFFFALCLLPQNVALFTRKTTKGVSGWMWVIQALGYTFGLVYGLNIHQWPLILGNFWGLICSAIFTIGFLKYRDK